MRTLMLAAALSALFVAPVFASPSSLAAADAGIRDTISQVNPKAVISSIRPTPIAGLKEVVADGTVVYISNDGRYLFHGVLLDVQAKQNLTDVAGSGARSALLATIPQSDKIVFKPQGKPKYTVTVFTDTSCHYCQMLHKSLADYMAKGIEIDYVPFPREGTQSPAYGQMIAVWCAKDRQDAYSTAIAGKPVPSLACANGVEKTYNLGARLNIEGTPAIYAPSGMQLGGFLPPDQLLTALQADQARTNQTAAVGGVAHVASANNP